MGAILMGVHRILPMIGQRYIRRDADVPERGSAEQRWAWAMADARPICAIVVTRLEFSGTSVVQYVQPRVHGRAECTVESFDRDWLAL